MSLFEIIVVAALGFVIILFYIGSKRDSGYRRFHSETERIEYRQKAQAERIAREERERASQRAKHETGRRF